MFLLEDNETEKLEDIYTNCQVKINKKGTIKSFDNRLRVQVMIMKEKLGTTFYSLGGTERASLE